ncbi:MAG: hypothetical protein QXO12_00985 [Candidatus Pacearchaeota archaeon]
MKVSSDQDVSEIEEDPRFKNLKIEGDGEGRRRFRIRAVWRGGGDW